MSIENFIRTKKENLNYNFHKWMEGNKVFDNDGLPIIVFRGGLGNDYPSINPDKLEADCYCGKGFYTTNSLDDVHENYVNINKDKNYQTDEKSYFESKDINAKFLRIRKKIENSLETFEDNDLFTASDIEELIGLESAIDIDLLQESEVFKNLLGDKIHELEADDFGVVDIRNLANLLAENAIMKQMGSIKPFYVKMEKPCYYTKDSNQTLITPTSSETIDSENSESKNLYIEIKNRVLNKCKNEDEKKEALKIFKELELFSMLGEIDDLPIIELFQKIRNTDLSTEYNMNSVKIKDYFNETIPELFDGIVLDANLANEDWGNIGGIDKDTKHYIVFNPNNVKSALGNNGEYSLENNDFCARRSFEQKEQYFENEKKVTVEEINNKLEKYNHFIDVQLKDSSTLGDNDAIYDRSAKSVYINEDKINSMIDLDKTIVHEVIGHAGLDFVLGKDKNKFLQEIADQYTEDDYADVKTLYPEFDYNNPEDRLKLTEEKICIYAESEYKHDSFMDKVLNTIKDAFIKIKKAFKISTPDDNVFSMIHKNNQEVEKEIKQEKKKKLKI